MGYLRNEKLLKTIGSSFKKLREDAGLSQERVYNDTGIHIGRVETAKSNLSISTVDRLCKYYKISLQDFIQGLKY